MRFRLYKKNREHNRVIVSKCPTRISIAGGGTDLQESIDFLGKGHIVSFSANVYTYITLFRDKFGQNYIDKNYNVFWSKTEKVSKISDIENDIARIVFEEFNVEPIHCWFTADVSSSGSGLASSSSHTIALIGAMNQYLSAGLSKREIIEKSWSIEKMFNPLTGFQDPFGCGTGGLNSHEMFRGSEKVISNKLSSNVVETFGMFLLPTNITRSSTKVLKSVVKNPSKNLLSVAEEMVDVIKNNDRDRFIHLIKRGWKAKKETSDLILGNDKLKNLDKDLENLDEILCHRLIGAGNGGYFLLFTKKNTRANVISKKLNSIVLPVEIDYNGLEVKNI